MRFYDLGMTALAGDDGLLRARVKSANTAGYLATNLSDEAAKTIGDSDPTLMINPGVDVTVIGPAASNAHGVVFTPVRLTGQDDNRVFWVRSSSLEVVPTAALVASAPSGRSRQPLTAGFTPTFASQGEGRPWWQYGLIAVGVAVVGFGVYRIVTPSRMMRTS